MIGLKQGGREQGNEDEVVTSRPLLTSQGNAEMKNKTLQSTDWASGTQHGLQDLAMENGKELTTA